jgi:hypothetical protein
MQVQRIVVGGGVLGTGVLAVISATLAIYALLDGRWVSTLLFGLLTALCIGVLSGLYVVWTRLAPKPVTDQPPTPGG